MSVDTANLTLVEDPPANAVLPAAAAVGTRLSFAFCKRHGVLIQEVKDGVAEAVYRDRKSVV